MEKTITLNELKPGDIILFSVPKNSKISILIGLLTRSKVSHTGMVDFNPGYVLEEIKEGATKSPLPSPGRTLYIRRLQNEPDTSEIVKIAMKYVDEKLPYPMSNLVLLGLYILAGDFIPDSFGDDIIKSLLKLATYEIINLVNEKTHPGTDVPPMVCSQFAAACYDEAALTYGPEYKIRYNDEVSSVFALLKKIIDQLSEDETKVFSLEPHKSFIKSVEDEVEKAAGISDHKELAEFHSDKLIQHIESHKDDQMLLEKPSHISDEVITAFYNYGKWFLRLFDGKTEYNDIETDQITAGEIKEVLEELLRFQEVFVTPGDLFNHTENLMDMGILTYTDTELAKYLVEN